MKTIDYILLFGLLMIVLIALQPMKKHLKGQGACCGGCKEIIEPDKKLKKRIGSFELKIEGMTCENCANKIKRVINQKEGVSAQVSHKKKRARIEYEKEVNVQEIIETIEQLGYEASL
ncbi:MAG: heavy metal-associated domain-containing protein [Bacillota bacterium]|nr:heavy metal-associated domain-containing protein [Bacillota bacterium]